MCSEPVLALLLLGLGLDEFSMSPSSILQIKEVIRSVKFKNTQDLARKALSLSTGKEVEELAMSRLREWAPHVFNLPDKK